jgi:hypothetical protein
MNLKDKANPGLRDAVVRGELKGNDLCNLSKEVSFCLLSSPSGGALSSRLARLGFVLAWYR